MTTNKQVLKFVEESAALCQPSEIVWITGEEAQLEELRKEALSTGELIKLNEEKLIDMCLEAEAEDVVNDGDVYQILTAPSDFTKVKESLEAQGLVFLSTEVTMIPQNYVDLDANQLATFNKMVDALEGLDDVQNVYHNVNLPEEDEE